MKDKTLRALLFGKSANIKYPEGRRTDFIFPGVEEGELPHNIMFSSEDGFILYLLKRIEKLEEALSKKK